MAVPRKRQALGRTHRRRSHHALSAPTRSICSNCKSVKMPHRICNSCGHYGGRQIIEAKTA